jgi:hypothetical protein
MSRFLSSSARELIERDYDGLVRAIKRDMDDKGLAVAQDFISPEFLAEMRSCADRLTPVCYEGGKRKPLIGAELDGTVFAEVAFSEFLLRLTNDLLAGFGVRLGRQDVYPAMNILLGPHGQALVKGWHFDATYLTVAVPVTMPPAAVPDSGQFRIWPNVRRFSQNKLFHRLYSNLMRLAVVRRLVKSYVINFIPGNLYFFYGFRSYHGTDLLDPDHKRVNCLINCGGPMYDRGNGRAHRY